MGCVGGAQEVDLAVLYWVVVVQSHCDGVEYVYVLERRGQCLTYSRPIYAMAPVG